MDHPNWLGLGGRRIDSGKGIVEDIILSGEDLINGKCIQTG